MRPHKPEGGWSARENESFTVSALNWVILINVICQGSWFIFMEGDKHPCSQHLLCVAGVLCLIPSGAQVHGVTLLKTSLLRRSDKKPRGRPGGCGSLHKPQGFKHPSHVLCGSSEMLLSPKEEEWRKPHSEAWALSPRWWSGDQEMDSSAQGCHHSQISSITELRALWGLSSSGQAGELGLLTLGEAHSLDNESSCNVVLK